METIEHPKKKIALLVIIVILATVIPITLAVAFCFFVRYRRQKRAAGIRLHDLQPDKSISKGPEAAVGEHRELPAVHTLGVYAAAAPVAELPMNQNPAVELDAGETMKNYVKEKQGFMRT